MGYTHSEKERAINETLKFLKSLREDHSAYIEFLRLMAPPTELTLRQFATMVAKLFSQMDDMEEWIDE